MFENVKKMALVGLAVAGVGAFGYGLAWAQAGGAGAGPTVSGEGSVGLQKPVNLSFDDMQKQGEGAVARIEMTGATVRRMLEKARSDRDVIKTLCLNDKLTQVDVTLRSARERFESLRGAIGRRDQELSSHEFQILQVYRGRADRLNSEAQLCIGNDLVIVGQTNVTTSIETGIPDDPVGVPTDPTVPVLPPPPVCSSCTL